MSEIHMQKRPDGYVLYRVTRTGRGARKRVRGTTVHVESVRELSPDHPIFHFENGHAGKSGESNDNRTKSAS